MKFNQSVAFTIIVCLVGLFIASLVAYVERSTLSTYQKNMPFISLGDNIKNRTTKGHLWFEELMAGDNGIRFQEDVMKLFEDSRVILQGAYDGTKTEYGVFSTPDDETKELLKLAIVDIDELMEASRRRWDFKQNFVADSLDTGEQAGGQLDQQFDETYERVQTSMDNLVTHINYKVTADSNYLDVLSWISISLVVLLLGILAVWCYRLQKRHERTTAENLQRLDAESNRIESLSRFVEAISGGNYQIEIDGDQNDGLIKRLLTMRDTLQANAISDQRRSWATTGLAQIGEILRNSNMNTTELYDSIIRFVVQYTKSNQGGLFLLNDENASDQYLELASCYAYERKKFITRRLDTGEGLVGQCFLEGQRIYLLEVPENYVQITSGLGGANPNCLLLVPMIVNEKAFGVIELASFRPYEDHEIELVEKFAESIASTISNVKINESTRLLLERTQQQAEEMRSQEEEMRQNMEELSATQEEMARKEREYINRIQELEQQLAVH
jgi:hypothetical protein